MLCRYQLAGKCDEKKTRFKMKHLDFLLCGKNPLATKIAILKRIKWDISWTKINKL